MDLGLTDKLALVTGADSGIGWHTARLLLAEGATVVVSDEHQTALDAAAAQLQAPRDKLHAFAADVTDAVSLANLHANTRTLGSVDIVVQSAGVTGAQGKFHEIGMSGWQRTLDVDLLGPVRLVREFLPDLREGGWARLVFLASEDAVQPYDDELPYCAAKAGVLALAKGLSRSYAQEGLLVNCVSPAFIATPMTDAMMEKRAEQQDSSVPEAIDSFLAEERPSMELKRRGRPEEVAAVITFLCSEQASFVNGSNYRVDSGSVATI